MNLFDLSASNILNFSPKFNTNDLSLVENQRNANSNKSKDEKLFNDKHESLINDLAIKSNVQNQYTPSNETPHSMNNLFSSFNNNNNIINLDDCERFKENDPEDNLEYSMKKDKNIVILNPIFANIDKNLSFNNENN